jgi:glutamate-ammonia-ligase adenylyltransferase
MTDLIEQLEQETERRWQAWQEVAAEAGIGFRPKATLLQQLKQVWEASEYVAQSCTRDPGLLERLVESGDLHRQYPAGELATRLGGRLAGVLDEPALQRSLRRFRRREMVRIIWRDIARLAPLSETLEDLSALADACIVESLGLLFRWAVEKLGTPRNAGGVEQRLVVLAMGKLGARELNLSSDIDLIFVYPEPGQVDGRRPLENEQFFIRLCQQLIKALGSQTADGFVFRVDTRLRPFGEAGPLAVSFGAMEHYYQSQAREWERYAMIKARAVCGEPASVTLLETMLRPFVYRRYLDFGAIESLRDMKRLISRELQRRGMADNVKLGPGGIREIEFIGQAFQLIRGGHDPELQVRPILLVLQRLEEKGLLPDYVIRELKQAYEFLRLVENRVQAWQDRQTHLLPESGLNRLRLARAMGFDAWEVFHRQLEHHRQRVHEHFDSVFAAPQTERSEDEESMLALWHRQLEEAQAIQLLERAGFKDGKTALKEIKGFCDSRACRGMGSRGRERLDQLMPMLLEAVARTDQAEVTLARLLHLLEAIARRTAYLALLVESPIALSQLVRLTAISPWVGERIARQPMLLDELLDPRRLYAPLRGVELEAELDTLLSALAADDLEQQMERLRLFARSNKLRVAAADITGVIPLMVVSDYLTEIAETVIRRVLAQSWQDLTGRYGRPTGIGTDTGFAVIGYGKLGGIELGYGSDLDMVFLHADYGPNAITDGERQVANDLFYTRLGQRMIHMFATRTPAGQLYEVDMRLRPNGNSGMLVSGMETFERYQREAAWTWEHQALLRARPVAGDPRVAARFESVRQQVLCIERDPVQLCREVREMREKMRASLDQSGNGLFDIKQGQGGIADIEFMVQYSVLRWASRYPDLVRWTDNVRLLESLSRHRLLPGEKAEQLADAYRSLRAVYHRKALSELPRLVADKELTAQRRVVRALWKEMMEMIGLFE